MPVSRAHRKRGAEEGARHLGDQFLAGVALAAEGAGEVAGQPRGVAKVEWHPNNLYPRVGFIVTNLSRSAERVTWFYNQRGKAEQYIKEGKNAA